MKTEYIGVRLQPRCKNRWQARLLHRGISICLGPFDKLIQAAWAYDTVLRKLRPDGYKCNHKKTNFRWTSSGKIHDNIKRRYYTVDEFWWKIK